MAKRGSNKSSGADTFAASADDRIVVLHGKELYLLREYTHSIEQCLRDAHGEIERFDFNGSETTLADVLDELRSYGLMQQHKLVVLNEADQFLSAGGEKDKRNRKAMEDYAQHPVEDATLLMRASAWRPGNLDKFVKKVGQVHKCEPPRHDRAVIWCRQRVSNRYNAEIEKPAAEMLIELVGIDLSRLDSELEKLATYVGPGGSITGDNVTTMVGMTREQLAWSIQEAICSGDPSQAFGRLRDLIEVSQVQTTPMMWSVVDLLRKVHAASAGLRQGMSKGQLFKPLKLWGSVGDAIMNAAKQLEPAEAAQLLRQAVQADRRIKSGFGNDVRSLEALTVFVADTMGRG